LAKEKGVHLFINNKTVGINAFDGVDISTGKNTNIAIKKVFVKKIEYPFSDCNENVDSVYYKIITNSNITYRQVDCYELCFAHQLNERCNCFDPRSVLYYSDKKFCMEPDEILCMLMNYFQFFLSDFKKYCDCPLECKSIKYEITSSISDYPNEPYGNMLLNNPKVIKKFKTNKSLTLDVLKNSLVSFNVFFDDLQYTELNQVKKIELVDLIAGIGVINF
jgi:hypothetical protein